MHFKRVAQVSPPDVPGGASPRPTATITSAIDSSSAVVVILYSPSNGLPGSSSTISTILPLSSPTITSTITTASTTSTTKEVLAATNATNASSTSLQSSLVLLGSTTSALINTSTSSKSAAAATGSAAAQSVKKSSNSGLVAGVAVLGALLGLALVALIYLILRRRRKSLILAIFPENANRTAGTKDQRGEYRPTFESKNIQNSPTASLENTINSLETQLHERDVQLRESQAILLQKGRSIGGSSLDDRQVNERFSRLSKIINDWVLTHFKKMHTGVSPARDVDSILQKSQPDYAILLGEPRMRYLVIRSLVAEVLVQAFNTEELIGNPALSELKQAIGVKCKESTLHK